MESIIQGWLSIWLYVLTAIGVVLAVKVYQNRHTWDRITILCTLAVIVLALHVLEEWVFPGGLHYSYNISHGSAMLSRYPMNRLTDMMTNFGAVVLGCIVLKCWGFQKPAALAVMVFSFFELVIHVVIGVNDMNTFAAYGANTLYSPGLVTSVFGFLPVGIALMKEVVLNKDNRATLRQWVMGMAAMLFLCFLLINLPEMVLGKEDSPYAFTNRGYYEQFAEVFEADQGYEYYEP